MLLHAPRSVERNEMRVERFEKHALNYSALCSRAINPLKLIIMDNNIWNETAIFRPFAKMVQCSEMTWEKNRKCLLLISPTVSIEELRERFPACLFSREEWMQGSKIYSSFRVVKK